MAGIYQYPNPPRPTISAELHAAILEGRPNDNRPWLGWENFGKFGFIGALDNTFHYDVWELETYEHKHYRTAAGPATISSTDVADGPGAGGAETVEIFYFDNEYLRRVQTVTLDGETPVLLTDVLDIYRMKVVTGPAAGDSRRSNQGWITAIDPDGPHVIASIPPHLNQTEMSHFTIPADKMAVLMGVSLTPTSAATHNETVHLFERPYRPDGKSVFRAAWSNLLSDASGQVSTNTPPLIVFAPKTDLVIHAIASSNVPRPLFASYSLVMVNAP